ncbi:MAG: GAF domain-containing sensor histidine kinase [Gemmatimonadaceae bacterium]|nr:GAF domain-containing sensor histidine kinase [Gemmatimonadaceae bacterium]
MISPEQRLSLATAALHDRGRLAEVRRTELVDSAIEETFDSLSRLAAALLRAPISFLSIVESDRDFYKSQCGMPEPIASERQITGNSFCKLVIASEEALVINDTHDSPVWLTVPTVQSHGIRSYLGVPLMVNGHAIGSFCVLDMTPREWTDVEVETLVQLTRSAEREIDLRRTLQSVTIDSSRARALARANEELIAVVAHDLRTPLQVIGITASLLSRQGNSTIREHVDRLEHAVGAMKQMVDVLLSQHAAGAPQVARREPVTTGKLLRDTVETMKVVSDHAGLRLSVIDHATATVSVDYAQMLRVFCNLIGNCVKYCPSGTEVRLSAARAGDGVMIHVADNGPGMSAGEQAQAFERGWQGGSPEARKHGSGLGLAIVHDLVEQNLGAVTLSGDVGRGTTVSIWLPVSESESRGCKGRLDT